MYLYYSFNDAIMHDFLHFISISTSTSVSSKLVPGLASAFDRQYHHDKSAEGLPKRQNYTVSVDTTQYSEVIITAI